MKKAITLFLLIAIIGLVSSQIQTKDKAKAVVQKDTLKKDKTTIEPEIVFNDSMIVVKGVFKPYKSNVYASYYANKFNGRRTASGKKFDNTKYTAAHRKLPFGTKLRITNEANGKSIIVEVTDRGPFSRGREIDLTKKLLWRLHQTKAVALLKLKLK
ncbi:septal ring lytic transglycosylase RlpA family protein [Flavobacterium myungsuense]|uniref:septal ring lytic transglycosylase RlpA family protein n=1 Tax=Flavobacterium myungsuense TaxID=651823 RepID=UPI0036399E43